MKKRLSLFGLVAIVLIGLFITVYIAYSNSAVDDSFYTVKTSNGIQSYTSNSDTYLLEGTTLDNLKETGIALKKGDGGKTWTKPNYPNNQIITADSEFSNDVVKDAAAALNNSAQKRPLELSMISLA